MSEPVMSTDRAFAPQSGRPDPRTEALPWLERLEGTTVVVKYGGNAMTDESLQRSFAEDVVRLRLVGLRPIVVHGGGPQISAMLAALGIESHFAGGYRVTTREAMDVVRMVLTGQVQRDIVRLINEHGPHAVGLSGEDARLLTARRRLAMVDGTPVDIGFVGDIESVRSDIVDALLDHGLVPVVSSIGLGEDGSVYNVNADAAAGALAAAVGADRLVMLTDVEGLYADWPDSTDIIRSLSETELLRLLPELESGMVPKMTACADAIAAGVPCAQVIDGRIPHALLLAFDAEQVIGTTVVPDGGSDT